MTSRHALAVPRTRTMHDRIFPSAAGVYRGAVGISRTMEATGQRDEAAMSALGTAIELQCTVAAVTRYLTTGV